MAQAYNVSSTTRTKTHRSDNSADDNGRQKSKSLAECLELSRERAQWTDVSFTFPDDAAGRLEAHKLVLASRSPVLEAMFYGHMAETSSVIKITDITKKTFRLFLR
jgi:hypothetical protein